MALGSYEQLNKAREQEEIKRILIEQEPKEYEEKGKGETITGILDNAKEFISGKFLSEFAAKDINLGEDEKKFLIDNADILKEKIKIRFESDYSLSKIKRSNLKHIVRNFFHDILGQADRYERYKREGKNIDKIKEMDSYKKTIETINNSIGHLEYYIVSLNEDDGMLEKEIGKKHGYLEKYDFYRYKDFSEKHKHQLSYGDYLRLFYLFRELETNGIIKTEYQKLRKEIENPWQFEVSKKFPPRIFNFDELEENLVEDEKGNLRIIERR